MGDLSDRMSAQSERNPGRWDNPLPAKPPTNKMNTFPLREKLITIARSKVGVTESGRNTGPEILKFQRATNLEGTGWPYCAAFVCWCVREWIKDGDVRAALGLKDEAAAEKWRPKTAAAFGFHEWAEDHGLLVFDDSPKHILHTGDIMTFDMSHIAIVATDDDNGITTIEGNTGATGGRDGEGVFEKHRQRSLARRFIRMIA